MRVARSACWDVLGASGLKEVWTMYWKLALVQHPMYLIIKEDTECAERTPPWGEPTIERYVDRVRANIAAIQRYPQLKLGYEWSALELEMLANEAPDVFEQMCALAREGRVAFYNGTYAQPHLQMLGSEANYRQFEYGMRVYRQLCKQQVHTYAHQESSVHDQVPQLLRAFGIEYATLPHFYSTLAWLDEGELAVRGDFELHFVHGHEFVAWQGLDGSKIDLYLRQPRGRLRPKDWWAQQGIADYLHAPPISIETPDLITVDEKWLAERDQADFVLLDDALATRREQCAPRARARLYANWSYVEGIRAEELSRNNWRAEAIALRAEALNALGLILIGRPADSTDAVWKTILASQHHDVYCFSAPELREKGVAWLQGAARDAGSLADAAGQALVAEIDTSGHEGQPMVVFNTVPHTQKAVTTADVTVRNPQILGPSGEVIPAEAITVSVDSTRVRFVAPADGLGYTTYWLTDGGEPVTEIELEDSITFENAFYRATVQPEGTFTSLIVKPSGKELLDVRGIRGNQISGTDSTGVSAKTNAAPSLEGLSGLKEWQPPKRGPELTWHSALPARVRKSKLGLTLTTDGRLNSPIEVRLVVHFYNELPRIDMDWTLTFDGPTSVGTYYDDASKLRVQWPLAFTGDINHDIAFGAIRAREGRPLLPASWIDISDGCRGLAYFHQGTPKHWVEDRTLVNLFAWGEDTNAIGGRPWRHNWPKAFDQRLRGTHEIHCAIYPHEGDWQAADVVSAARAFGAEPVAYVTDAHGGQLPASTSVLVFSDPNIATTAVKVDGPDVLCRLYAVGTTATTEARYQGLRPMGLHSLTGEEINVLTPFQIGEMRLESSGDSTSPTTDDR